MSDPDFQASPRCDMHEVHAHKPVFAVRLLHAHAQKWWAGQRAEVRAPLITFCACACNNALKFQPLHCNTHGQHEIAKFFQRIPSKQLFAKI